MESNHKRRGVKTRRLSFGLSRIVHARRFERRVPRLKGGCYSTLAWRAWVNWSRCSDSNRGPRAPEACALPTELHLDGCGGRTRTAAGAGYEPAALPLGDTAVVCGERFELPAAPWRCAFTARSLQPFAYPHMIGRRRAIRTLMPLRAARSERAGSPDFPIRRWLPELDSNQHRTR